MGVPRSIITIYYLICPPFLPNLWTVRLININKVIFYHILESPKFPLEQFLRDLISVRLIVIALYNNGTFVEVEIVFGLTKMMLLTGSGTRKIVKKPDSEQLWRLLYQRTVFVGYHLRDIDTLVEGIRQWLAVPRKILS